MQHSHSVCIDVRFVNNLETIAGILALYFLVSFPLQLIGAITAKNFSAPFEAPTRTKKVPREIPPTVWYKNSSMQILVAGFLPFSAIYIELYYVFISMWSLTMYTPYPILFLVFVILVMVTSCITIAMTYLQLSQEDHQWWWRAIYCGGYVYKRYLTRVILVPAVPLSFPMPFTSSYLKRK